MRGRGPVGPARAVDAARARAARRANSAEPGDDREVGLVDAAELVRDRRGRGRASAASAAARASCSRASRSRRARVRAASSRSAFAKPRRERRGRDRSSARPHSSARCCRRSPDGGTRSPTGSRGRLGPAPGDRPRPAPSNRRRRRRRAAAPPRASRLADALDVLRRGRRPDGAVARRVRDVRPLARARPPAARPRPARAGPRSPRGTRAPTSSGNARGLVDLDDPLRHLAEHARGSRAPGTPRARDARAAPGRRSRISGVESW